MRKSRMCKRYNHISSHFSRTDACHTIFSVNSAAATVMKLLIKSQLSGAMGTGGGAAGGGMGQLLSMASK